MNTTSNLLVEDCGVENSDIDELEEQEYTYIENEEDSKQLLFRDNPIEFTIDDIEVTENALDSANPDISKKKRASIFIRYEDKEYSKENFYKAMFKDYRKYPFKAQFENDSVFYLSNSQRAKLQYDILAYRFGLVDVAEQDKKDLEHFCIKHDTQTAQKWYSRMMWKRGHEKMIAFGSALGVRSYKDNGKTVYSSIKGVYCYRMKYENNTVTYFGLNKTWEQWQQGMIDCIERRRIELKDEQLKENDRQCIISMYYQNGTYLTLPTSETSILRNWLNEYIKKGYTTLKLNGDMPNADLQFTICYDDIEIVKQHDNTQHNQEMGYKRVLNTFNSLLGNEWITQEIYKQGFNKGNIERFIKYGLIERTKRGHYRRILSDTAATEHADCK
jgi:hypothetical protein